MCLHLDLQTQIFGFAKILRTLRYTIKPYYATTDENIGDTSDVTHNLVGYQRNFNLRKIYWRLLSFPTLYLKKQRLGNPSLNNN